MQVFAAVRAAGDGHLRFRQAEAFGRSTCQDGDGLEGFSGGAEVRDRLRLAQGRDEAAVAVHGGDVAAVARLDDGAAPDFDERRGFGRWLTLIFGLQVR